VDVAPIAPGPVVIYENILVFFLNIFKHIDNIVFGDMLNCIQ
jgi:hypothetical protein